MGIQVAFPQVLNVGGLAGGFIGKLGGEQFDQVAGDREHMTAAELQCRNVGGEPFLFSRRTDGRRKIAPSAEPSPTG